MLLTNSLWSFKEVGRFLPICHMQTFGRGLRLLCVPWVLRRFVSTKFLRIGVLRMQLTDLICGECTECTTTMQRTVQPSWPINSAHRSFGNFGSTWQYHVHGVTASAELSRLLHCWLQWPNNRSWLHDRLNRLSILWRRERRDALSCSMTMLHEQGHGCHSWLISMAEAMPNVP